jgi:hypothetical protein
VEPLTLFYIPAVNTVRLWCDRGCFFFVFFLSRLHKEEFFFSSKLRKMSLFFTRKIRASKNTPRVLFPLGLLFRSYLLAFAFFYSLVLARLFERLFLRAALGEREREREREREGKRERLFLLVSFYLVS